MDPAPVWFSPQSHTCCQLAEPFVEGERSPSSGELGRDSPFPRCQLPGSRLIDASWFGDEHIKAKRARVETIVRGMCSSPGPLMPGSARARDSSCCPGKTRKRRRKQSLPVQQGPQMPSPAPGRGPGKGAPGVREELHLLKRQPRHLQEHVLQGPEPGADPGRGDPEPGADVLRAEPRTGRGPGPWAEDADPRRGRSTDCLAEVEGQSEEPRGLLEVLKGELSTAVLQAVESVLHRVLSGPPGYLGPRGRGCQGARPAGASQPSPPRTDACKDPQVLTTLPKRARPQAGVPFGNVSLVRPLGSAMCSVSPRGVPKPYQAPRGSCPLTMVSPHVRENQILNQLLGYGPSARWAGGPSQDSSSQSHASPESALRPWVLSQQQPPLPFSASAQSRSLLPCVKTEQRPVQAALPFSSIHEGLNPSHLKKAKLMFFFTRYPSSSLLKTYFPDVQFNRCITSQMIKWFSNFREFYYIQMEKYARQAISDGITNPKMLVVLRDSELFRALNTHYNKGNDFEVPDCFLEIASLTLQEFFRAVSSGKDSDPSWKKPIYKIISKLDSNIPEIFKSSSYPQELFRS